MVKSYLIFLTAILVLAVALTACGGLMVGLDPLEAKLSMATPTGEPSQSPPTEPVATAVATAAAPTALPTPKPSPTRNAGPTAFALPTATAEPRFTPTPDAYAGCTIDELTTRTYGGGELQIEAPLVANEAFVRTLIHYPSDGLRIYGFMDVPRTDGPFPVAIVLHGYIPPYRYHTVTYTARYVDALARAGYIAIHPNLRGYPPSDDGENLFRTGFAADVLNLIAIIKEQAGHPGPLEQADPSFVGLMGHSMGGGVALRVATVSDDISALVLYGAMSGDEQKNYAKIDEWSYGWRGREERDVPAADLLRIAPIYFLDRIQAPVSIHHGEVDELVPLEWSLDLYDRLAVLHKSVECHVYQGQLHTFSGEGDRLLMERLVTFFDQCRSGTWSGR